MASIRFTKTEAKCLKIVRLSEFKGNSIELQLVTRNLFGKSRSAATRGSDPDQPINTAGTEDTEMTHSACPTLSAPEARSWYN